MLYNINSNSLLEKIGSIETIKTICSNNACLLLTYLALGLEKKRVFLQIWDYICFNVVFDIFEVVIFAFLMEIEFLILHISNMIDMLNKFLR